MKSAFTTKACEQMHGLSHEQEAAIYTALAAVGAPGEAAPQIVQLHDGSYVSVLYVGELALMVYRRDDTLVVRRIGPKDKLRLKL